MQLNELLQRLKGVKGNGNQYKALCPAHHSIQIAIQAAIQKSKE